MKWWYDDYESDLDPYDVYLGLVGETEEWADFMSLHFEEQRGRYDDYDKAVISEVIWR